jgi:cell division protein FtsX
MNTKLTLKLESSVINQAKKYARKHQTSVSKMVENYLKSVTHEEMDQEDISPLVKSLSGVIDAPITDKSSYLNFLNEKYQ